MVQIQSSPPLHGEYGVIVARKFVVLVYRTHHKVSVAQQVELRIFNSEVGSSTLPRHTNDILKKYLLRRNIAHLDKSFEI